MGERLGSHGPTRTLSFHKRTGRSNSEESALELWECGRVPIGVLLFSISLPALFLDMQVLVPSLNFALADEF